MSEKRLKRRGPTRHTEETKKKIRAAALRRDNSNYGTHRYSTDYPRLYGLWTTMKGRCENPNRPKYKDYGARGISICKEWHDASVFCDWALKNGYKEGMQLDRIDNNGNYEPSNCRWVTAKENSRNRRNTVYLTLNGETKCVSEWCETIDVSPNTIYWWVRKWGREYAEQRIEEKLKSA